MRIIKLHVEGEGFYVLAEGRMVITTPDREVETLWVRISGHTPVDAAMAAKYIACYPEAEVIEHADSWGRLPEGVEGHVI